MSGNIIEQHEIVFEKGLNSALRELLPFFNEWNEEKICSYTLNSLICDFHHKSYELHKQMAIAKGTISKSDADRIFYINPLEVFY